MTAYELASLWGFTGAVLALVWALTRWGRCKEGSQ